MGQFFRRLAAGFAIGMVSLLWLSPAVVAHPEFVQITGETALLRTSPDATADISYSAFPGAIFTVVTENETYYQLRTVDEALVWVLKSNVMGYLGALPPVHLLGVATQLNPDLDVATMIADTPEIVTASAIPPPEALDTIPPSAIASRSVVAPPDSPSTMGDQIIPTALSAPQTDRPDPAPVIPTPSLAQKIMKFVETDVSRSENVAVPTSPMDTPRPVPVIRYRPYYTFLPSVDEMFVYPPKPISRYPQLDVDGLYEMKLSGRDYRPKLNQMSATDNRWGIIQNDPVYTKLPSDVLVGSPKFDMRFRFNIDGKLADDLSVHYDIEQEPDFPGKYDVSVKYQRQDLTFFHLDSEFQNGEFINYKKSLNGVRYTNSDPNWSAIVSWGKQRSEPRKFEANGNGRAIYNVGVKSLLNDSVKVWVNNVILSEGADYKVNYFEGDITFATVKGPADHIEVIYEFTNPIEDFIPVLSRKNFFGAQYLWRASEIIDEVPRVLTMSESVAVPPSSNLIGSSNLVLKSRSIVLGSEQVFLNGIPLRRNTEYSIKGRRGEISFLKRTLQAGDVVSVNYSAIDVFDAVDELIGNDSRGPYALSSPNVLEDSETVLLNRQSMTSGIDYVIDYDKGTLQFAYPISYPTIITVKYRAARTDPASSNALASGSPINFGFTYLDENAKGQDDQMEMAVTSENISFSGSVLTLANNPVSSPESLVVIVNGSTFVSGNESVPNSYTLNAYTGQLTLNGSTGGTAQVSYKYRKAYQTTYVFQAIGNGVNIYQNTNQMNLRDVPVKWNGVRYIKLYNGAIDETLVPSQDYTITYGNGNDGFVIRFYKRGDTVDSSAIRPIRERYPDAGQRITLVYDHSPDAATDAGTIAQHQFGLTFGTKLSKNFRVDTELSGAENNLTHQQLQTKFEGTGQGSGATYSLGFRNIVENSETLYLNDVPLAKDREYSINYVNGTFRFINLSPGNSDKIFVQFKYVDPSGQTHGGASKGYRFALKLGAQFKDGPWTANADWKSIDKDYSPISPIQSPRGNQSLGGSVQYAGTDGSIYSSDFRQYLQYLPPSGVKDNLFRHTTDSGFRAKQSWADWIDVDQSVRFNFVYSDSDSSASTGNIYPDDVASLAWKTDVGIGGASNRYTLSRSYSKNESGYMDGYDRSTNETDAYRLGTSWKWDNLPILGNTDVKPSFEYSQTTARAYKTATGVQSSQLSFNRNLGVVSHYSPIPQWEIGADFSTQEQNTIIENVSGTPNRLTNYRFESTYKPAGWIALFGSFRNNEEFSPLLGQKGRLSSDSKYQISRFVPSGLLNSLGVKDDNLAVAAIKNSYFSVDYGMTDSKENNDQLRKSNTSKSIAYNAFSPIPGVSFPRITYSTETNQSQDDAPTGVSSRNAVHRDYSAYSGQMDVRLPVVVLDKFAYSLKIESKRETQATDYLASTATSNSAQESTPFDKRTQSLGFDPGPLAVGIPGILMVPVGTFKANFDENLYNSTSVKESYLYSATSSNRTTAQDNTNKYDVGGTVSLSPFNLIGINGGGRYYRDLYSRNLSVTNTGLTYRIAQTYTADTAYSPLPFIGFTFSGRYDQSHQYRSPSLNLDVETLQSPDIRTTPTLFTDLLIQRSLSGSVGATITPISWFSIKGAGGYSQITDSQTTTANQSSVVFAEKTGTAGLEFRPYPGLSTGYDYTLRFTSTEGGADSNGYSGRFSASYSPVQTPTMNISITYTRYDTWGRTLNRLQQKEIQQGTGDSIRYTVDLQNNTVETGSLTINLVVPFKDNPYLRDLTVTGEGQIKRVTDAFDSERAASGVQQIGYEISGLVVKAVIRF